MEARSVSNASALELSLPEGRRGQIRIEDFGLLVAVTSDILPGLSRLPIAVELGRHSVPSPKAHLTSGLQGATSSGGT